MADNCEEILCPACNKKMKKVFVPSAGMNVDICVDGCGGIYFDRREFKRVDEQHEDITPILNEIDNKTFQHVDQSLKRSCPNCGAIMVKNYSSATLSVQIDECYTCGGTFLDNGELQKIRDEFATEEERSAHFTKKFYELLGEEYKKTSESKELLKSDIEQGINKDVENGVRKALKTFISGLTFGLIRFK